MKRIEEQAQHDEVLEAGLQSFPASDPPAFAQSGPKELHPDTDEPESAAKGAGSPQGRAATVGADTARLRGAMKSGRTMNISAAEEPAAVQIAMAAEAAPAGRPGRLPPGAWVLGAAGLLALLLLWLVLPQR